MTSDQAQAAAVKAVPDEALVAPHIPFVRGKAGARPALGADGNPMSVWQIWLKRLCGVMIAWAVLELFLVAALWLVGLVWPHVQLMGTEVPVLLSSIGVSALASAVLNLVIGGLGIRGAKNPHKITLFFWITLADAVITAWAMASNISMGLMDFTGAVSGLFIIALAVCAWQVRGQTGYFDEHP